MKSKSLNYSMDIVRTRTSTPLIYVNPRKHNIEINKEMGSRRFYMNDRGLKKYGEFILEQWNNNLNNEE